MCTNIGNEGHYPPANWIVISATYRIGPELGNGCRVELVELFLQAEWLVLLNLVVLREIKELPELGRIRVRERDLRG